MAHFVASVVSPRSAADVFAYLADLRNLPSWDAGVKRSTQVKGNGAGSDGAFDVVVRGVGRDLTLRYLVTEYDEPNAITIEARSSTLLSLDRITVEPEGAGCRVSYDAVLRFLGPAAVFNPLLGTVFNRIGERALVGLRRELGEVTA